MNTFGLPDDCFEFLGEGKQLWFDVEECEAGPVQLRSTDELKLERLPVETYPNTFREEDPLLNKEGFYNESGFYSILAVPLTQGDRVSYSILLWLPLEKVFATYDDDHHDLLLFHNTTWPQIVADPLKCLNAL